MAFTFRFYTNLTMTCNGDGLTNGESQTSALNEVVQFDETIEDLLLMLFGNTGTSVFAVDVQLPVVVTVAHLDVALMGVLHGVGDEIGDDLLDASVVNMCDEGSIWILLDELHARFQHTTLQRFADIIETLGEVDFFRFDVHATGIG